MKVIFEYSIPHTAVLMVEADTVEEAMDMANPVDADWDLIDDVSQAEIVNIAIVTEV
jgi:hypothetical protein